ncbi:MAG: tRNA1(Val) (adenine(37)-N6)-methyltransferase [Fusobacteria bacterium]|nr:tRNA1(Val) (adenine(37)-N6)-methyltransferase [Fusobacteriota bacterium]
MDKEVIIDFLNMKNLKIIQRNDHFNFSLDSVLVANFATINRNIKNIIDLGTGNAAIPLILSRRSTANITGIEIQKSSYFLAKKNIKLNNLDNRINVINNDIKNIKNLYRLGSFDLVISNPPFYLEKEIQETNNKKNEFLLTARHELLITLEDIINNGSYLLREKGYFTLVHRVERLEEIFYYFKKYNIAVKRIQFIYSNLNKRSKIVLIEGVKNGKQGVIILPPFVTHDENNNYSINLLEIFSCNKTEPI